MSFMPTHAQDEGDDRVDRVSERYSADAEGYQRHWSPILRPHGRRLIDRLGLDRAARVIDAASGTGALLADLRRAAPAALVIAADCAPGMLAMAPRDFPRVVMDARRLGFDDETFDAAVMAFALFHIPRPLDAISEIARVLRVGGVFGATTWDGDPDFPGHDVWIEELDAHGAAAAPVVSNHDLVNTTAKMTDLLERANFSRVESWREPFMHCYSVRSLIDARSSLGSTRIRLESLTPDTRQAVLASIHRRLEKMPPDDLIDRAMIVYSTAQR